MQRRPKLSEDTQQVKMTAKYRARTSGKAHANQGCLPSAHTQQARDRRSFQRCERLFKATTHSQEGSNKERKAQRRQCVCSMCMYERNGVAHAKVGTVTGSEVPRKHRAGGACGTSALIASRRGCVQRDGGNLPEQSNGARTPFQSQQAKGS